MLIAHVISSLATGGAEKLVAELSEIFEQKKNIKVRVISILDCKGIPYEMLKERGIEVIELKCKRLDLSIIPKLRKYTQDCDIVHTHTYYAQLYSSIAIHKNKLITTEHNTWNRRRNIYLFKLIDYMMYKKYNKIICISQDTKTELNSWLNSTTNKSIVVNNGINLRKYQEARPIDIEEFGINEKEVVFICVARFDEQKNHKNLIEAFKLSKYNAHLILVGDGLLKKEGMNRVKELGMTDRIHFLGIRDDVEKLLKSSNIFILVSKWEGFGLVTVEAMASGTPVIISDVPGLNQFVENSDIGVLVNQNDIEDIAKKIDYMIENIDKLDEIKLNCIKKSQNYSIESMAEKYLEMYMKMYEDKIVQVEG